VVPIIIDFWGKNTLKSFYNYYKNCPFILISSIEVFEYLKKNNSPLNIYHFPLSLPDKYKLDEKRTNNKKYDIVLAGRINPILWKYLKEFEKSHPNIEYLFQEQINGELFYRSNKMGIIGKFQSRNSYFELIKSARICFYASPGIDSGEFRTGGFNPITPRFLEFLSAGCHVIARYPLNEESCFYKMESICPPINTYKEFEEQLSWALSAKDQPIQRNSNYLSNHYTSKRVPLLIDILSNLL
jgi:hypothetical protein